MTDNLDISDLDAQIAALQAEKAAKLAKAEKAQKEREKEEARVLVGLTPTKTATKERAEKEKLLSQLPKRPVQPKFQPKSKLPAQQLPSIPNSSTSRFSSSLASIRQKGSQPTVKPKPRSRSGSLEVDVSERRDRDDLTVVEDLRVGPREFGKDPEGADVWEFLEPNSGVRLSKRTTHHEAVQAHLSGRYHLSPSQIYSIIRLSRDGATYDIPVEGDWLTIAVVAERGEIRVSGTKESTHDHSDEEDPDQEDETPEAKVDKRKEKDVAKWKKRRGPRKYINLKLCALGPRTPGTKTLGGDAMLQLLLFESDAVVRSEPDESGEVKKSYRGGSGGAYEKWCNLGVGSVVVVMNPRVLRPLRSGGAAPHPLTLPLALNPWSGEDIMVIGTARDLGCCSAVQKDGNRCKTWVDLRQGQVCEYHVHAAVQRGRAGRAEFTASTSSFSLSTKPNATGSSSSSKPNYKTRTGLLPSSGAQAAPRTLENGGGGATYMIQGNPINTSGGFRGAGDEHLSEKLGRGRMEKRKRKEEMKEAEEVLGRLLDGDRGSTGGKYLAALGKAVEKGKGKEGEGEGGEEGRKRPFSVGAVKRIGFDPSAKVGVTESGDRAKKMAAIASFRSGERVVRLGRPANTNKSNVKAPEPEVAIPVPLTESAGMVEEDGDEGMIDLD